LQSSERIYLQDILKENLKMDAIKLNIAGDLFLGRRLESIAQKNPESLFDTKVLQLFSGSDFNVLNLESPLTNASDEHQILKTGPNLRASPGTIGVLDLLKINLVTLANNHIYDYGDKGLSDTLELCKKHNISTVGAELTLHEASKIFLKKIDQFTIGFVNIAENEWGNANDNHGGANPMNIIANTRSINEAKKLADVVILVIHGGHEYYHYPSPRMVEQYRFYAEQGASIIIGHHSHYISGYEIFEGVPIFYGLGNFLFDSTTDSKGWYRGILVSIGINMQKEITWKLHPFKQCHGNLKVELLEGEEKSEIENEISNINSIIADPEKLKEKFNGLVESQKKLVLSMFSTSYLLNQRYFRSAIRKLGLERFFLRKVQLKSILNYSRCEAHKDITFEVLLNYLETK
jgi:poly-gamma-glutamate capsule biosynthesis protein CapA/YwtB (metallophosphatase superfamily)